MTATEVEVDQRVIRFADLGNLVASPTGGYSEVEAVVDSDDLLRFYSPAGGSGAPVGAEYLVGASDGTLTAERVVTDTATIEWDLATGGQAKAAVADSSIGTAKLGDDITAYALTLLLLSTRQAVLDEITDYASANPGDVLVAQDSGAGFADPGPRQSITFISAQTKYTSQPAAINFWAGSASWTTYLDIGVCTKIRIIAHVDTVGFSGSKIVVRFATSYSGTASSYSKFGASSTEVYASLTTGAAIAFSSWIDIDAAATSAGSVYVMIGGIDGNGSSSPIVSMVRVELK